MSLFNNFDYGFYNVKDVQPGEMLVANGEDIKIKRYAKCKKKAHCIFEWVYFANASSVIDDSSVYLTRSNTGKHLARNETENITKEHIVVPVPDRKITVFKPSNEFKNLVMNSETNKM